MLTILPECGDHYLPVFRCIHGFCAGEGFLGSTDQATLLEQMKLSHVEEGEGEGEGGGERETTEKEKDKDGGGAKNGMCMYALCYVLYVHVCRAMCT